MKVTRNVICKACNGQFSFFLFLTTAHTKMNQIEVNLIERTLFFCWHGLTFSFSISGTGTKDGAAPSKCSTCGGTGMKITIRQAGNFIQQTQTSTFSFRFLFSLSLTHPQQLQYSTWDMKHHIHSIIFMFVQFVPLVKEVARWSLLRINAPHAKVKRQYKFKKC